MREDGGSGDAVGVLSVGAEAHSMCALWVLLIAVDVAVAVDLPRQSSVVVK